MHKRIEILQYKRIAMIELIFQDLNLLFVRHIRDIYIMMVFQIILYFANIMWAQLVGHSTSLGQAL